MKRLLFIALLFPLNSFSQSYDPFYSDVRGEVKEDLKEIDFEPYTGGTLSSRSIDSVIMFEETNSKMMADRSLKEQRARNKALRKSLPKQFRPYRLISVTVQRDKVDPNARDGKAQTIFTHTWYAFFNNNTIYENNAFLSSETEINYSNPRELAIKKLEEQKKLLDLEVITREEYDSIRKVLTPIIID